MPSNRLPVVVIGGGLGGLAAACTLAARGVRVTLCERNTWLGGKAAVWERDGFRFDMGPTILTLPRVLARIFGEAGVTLADRLELIRLDPQWRSFFVDGSVLDLRQEPTAMQQELDGFAPGMGHAYGKFLDFSSKLHDVSERYFFWRSVGGLRDTYDPQSTFQWSVLRDVLRMRLGRTVAGTVRHFVPEPRVAQLLDHFTQYVGSAPDQSPAVLCGIAHMQTQDGVWYPQGGTRAVALALVALAEELGVELRTGEGVRQVQLETGQARGVVLDSGETLAAAAVVSNSDAVRTHRELLPDKNARAFLRRRSYEPACSGVVWYLGLRRGYDHLLHHNFVFSADPHQEFAQIYRQGEPAADPTCYVCAPARTDSTVAPPGGEALYVLAHTPYLRSHHDWRGKLWPAYRQVLLDKLVHTAGLVDLAERIVCEHVLTPQDIHERYHVLDGAIYGLASHGRWLGAFKPPNRSREVPGLYLAGGAAHPGPGMPMVLMSGWIAADSLLADLPQLAGGARGPHVSRIPSQRTGVGPSWASER